jgi:hypothetical protein
MEERARKKTERRAPLPAPLDDVDWDALPKDGEAAPLHEARRALEVGDHRRVRALVAPLREARSEAVRVAAARLLARVSIDPAQLALLGLCALFLVSMVLVFYR